MSSSLYAMTWRSKKLQPKYISHKYNYLNVTNLENN